MGRAGTAEALGLAIPPALRKNVRTFQNDFIVAYSEVLEPLLDALHARNAHRAPRYSAATATSAMNCDSHFFRRLTFSR